MFSPAARTLHQRLNRPHRAAFAASLYLIFGIADLLFSLVAFSYGIPEGNPVMAWFLDAGLFLPAKIGLSLLVAVLMLVVYGRAERWRWVAWGGVGVMGAVVGFHLLALPRIAGI